MCVFCTSAAAHQLNITRTIYFQSVVCPSSCRTTSIHLLRLVGNLCLRVDASGEVRVRSFVRSLARSFVRAVDTQFWAVCQGLLEWRNCSQKPYITAQQKTAGPRETRKIVKIFSRKSLCVMQRAMFSEKSIAAFTERPAAHAQASLQSCSDTSRDVLLSSHSGPIKSLGCRVNMQSLLANESLFSPVSVRQSCRLHP